MNWPKLLKGCTQHLDSNCYSETQLKATFQRQQGNYISTGPPKVTPCLRHNNDGFETYMLYFQEFT